MKNSLENRRSTNPILFVGLDVHKERITKLATELGIPPLKELGYASKLVFQQQKLEVLRTCH